MSKRTVFYTTDYSDVPLIRLRYADSEFYAIVDSGSESTLIDKNFVEEVGLEQSNADVNITYIGFGGVSDVPLSSSYISCSVVGDDMSEEYPIGISATISDLSSIQSYFNKWSDDNIRVPLLIGSDMLSNMEATIDFENQMFSFYDDGEDRQETP